MILEKGFIDNKMLEQKLEKHHIKPTAMRLLVLRQMVESGVATSLRNLEAKFDKADRATLFRTLKTFEEKKLIHSIDDGTGAIKYALCEEGCECVPKDQHLHFHCVHCKETYCLTNSKIPEVQIPTGFIAASASMVYKGICANCS
ncbi:Fur family transcriptional regulator [Reichenbachiella versicolor]|uniref:Fur family transcriptional regulator n=1 Tax=Reichenbachiella versicolor TaxID=1821036 RepID=UPI001FE6C657|nr:transcriptional repressor [Reichenbachiella versicolor]